MFSMVNFPVSYLDQKNRSEISGAAFFKFFRAQEPSWDPYRPSRPTTTLVLCLCMRILSTYMRKSSFSYISRLLEQINGQNQALRDRKVKAFSLVLLPYF